MCRAFVQKKWQGLKVKHLTFDSSQVVAGSSYIRETVINVLAADGCVGYGKLANVDVACGEAAAPIVSIILKSHFCN